MLLMLLMDDARGSRLLQMVRGRRPLLRVVGMVLQQDTTLAPSAHLVMSGIAEYNSHGNGNTRRVVDGGDPSDGWKLCAILATRGAAEDAGPGLQTQRS
jgi:hypothetical protein